MANGRELGGWGQIAGYLGVSVRTAQVYERDLNLPVHRLPGPKGRVWASVDELDAWKLGRPEQRDSEKDQRSPIVGAALPGSSLASLRRKRLNSLLWPFVAVLVVVLAGAVYGLTHLGHARGRPTGFRVTGSTLTVLGGEDGHELWHYTFPAQLRTSFYTGDSGHGNRCVFVDLDGDGTLETVFSYVPLDQAGHPKLICFASDGRLRWEFATDRKIIDHQSREWDPPYYPNSFSVISPKLGRPTVVVSSNHYWGFPDQVAVMNAAGKVVSEFWHRGHLTEMAVADLDGNGQPKVLVGGVNDAPEYKQATLLVFDHRSISGGSSSPSGEQYFRGCGLGTEQTLVFFPKTLLGQRHEFNRVSDILVEAGRITVVVSESETYPDTNFVLYEMDSQLNVLSATLSDQAKTRYRELEASGEFPKGAVLADVERLKREVKVFRRQR